MFLGDIGTKCPAVANHIIILGKHFIYKTRYLGIIPKFEVFKQDVEFTVFAVYNNSVYKNHEGPLTKILRIF